ncbi:glycosyltransferase domain-containing protein [Cesiribacter sp. SM1]|uniref:glycosyltransferase domain-containing protein n=1 Tax=Cesiribacter sp. SM1 TaxID=2861196 RepID=UPI001CD26CBE|nr:glycosyltransferase domain-containing protein [Cesiribacter sp. SM1]
MARLVVYTSVFGNKEGLLPQPKSRDVDYVCFADNEMRVPRPWQLKLIEPAVPGDPARSSRAPKLMPHSFLPDYSYSLYIDANFLVRGNFAPFVLSLLPKKAFWAFGHGRNCIYDEHQAIIEKYHREGVLKDNFEVMQRQIDRYRQENFPPGFGLISGGVLMRNHHHPEVAKAGELWWNEVKNGSRRDQLSFNYVVWKTGLDYGVLPGDLRKHKHFYMIGIHRKDYKWKYFRYRFKHFLGLV